MVSVVVINIPAQAGGQRGAGGVARRCHPIFHSSCSSFANIVNALPQPLLDGAPREKGGALAPSTHSLIIFYNIFNRFV